MLAKFSKNACEACMPWAMVVLRVALAIVLINHGYPKLFGDTAGLLAFFESTVLPMPGLMLLLAGIIELVGGILLLFGAFTRAVAYALLIEFAVIILFVKFSKGLTAMEVDLLIFGAAFALSALGAGSYSIDRMLQDRKRNGSEKGGHSSEAIGGMKTE